MFANRRSKAALGMMHSINGFLIMENSTGKPPFYPNSFDFCKGIISRETRDRKFPGNSSSGDFPGNREICPRGRDLKNSLLLHLIGVDGECYFEK